MKALARKRVSARWPLISFRRGEDRAGSGLLDREGPEVDLGRPQHVLVAGQVGLEEDHVAHVEEAVLEDTTVDGVA